MFERCGRDSKVDKKIYMYENNYNKIRRCKMMKFLKDEGGQGAAEYILLFGGVIVIAIVALLIYRNYFQSTSLNSAQDIQNVRNNVGNLGGG